MPVTSLKKPSEFAAVRERGHKAVAKGLVLQVMQRLDSTLDPFQEMTPRLGLVVPKKFGNAVVRNRTKRRLRALCSEVLHRFAHPSYDYVIIAREAIKERMFNQLQGDLKFALHHTHTFLTHPAPISRQEAPYTLHHDHGKYENDTTLRS